ncbi:DUF7573 domain-containing protein [Halobacterium yunchengense]|uniref:DUF7573 domain-containing protein n=1 Tax=Halobacterium yunchengense TaxID=3108497 RepID=UPI00300B3F3E
MPEEATLDAFVDDGDEESTEPSGREASAGGDSPATAEPAAVTSSWEEGGACPACGEPAGRLWVADGQRCCTACRSWD